MNCPQIGIMKAQNEMFKPHNYAQLRYGQYQKIPSEITAVSADREVLRIYIVKENLTHFSASSQDKKVL